MLKLRISFYLLLLNIFFTSLIFSGPYHEGIEYIHPLPEAKLLSSQTTVIIRLEEGLNSLIDDPDSLIQIFEKQVIPGLESPISGNIIWSSDGKTIIFKPASELKAGYTYRILIETSQVGFQDYVSEFTVAKPASNPPARNDFYDPSSSTSVYLSPQEYKPARVQNGVALPNWFPDIEIEQNGETAQGYLSFAMRGSWGNYIVMLNNDGTPYFYREYPVAGNVLLHYTDDHPKGLLTGFMGPSRGYYIFNHNFEHIDTYFSGHGYVTDNHEIEIKPNGHVLIIAAQDVYVDVSGIIDGGNTNAKVQYKHFQELDIDHNVVFEWRSIDYFDISDAIGVPLTGSAIDNVHMNAIDVDYDGHYLISSKTMDEITKINSKSGEIIWRFGGVNNQFSFLNDEYDTPYHEAPYPAAWQHDIRAVPGKPDEYTYFDNRNYEKDGSPVPEAFSRAAHYKIDPINMTAEKVWEFRMTPDLYCYGKGSMQVMPNGNYYIDWTNKGNGVGADQQQTQDILGTEVNQAGEIVYKFRIENANTYRSRRLDWDGYVLKPELYLENYGDYVRLLYNKFGDKSVESYNVFYGSSPSPTSLLVTTALPYYDIPATQLASGRKYYFRVTAVDSSGAESSYSNEESTTVNYSSFEPGQNMIINGDFADGFSLWGWNLAAGNSANYKIDTEGQLHVEIENGGSEPNNIQVKYSGLPLNLFTDYIFEFDAYADGTRLIEAEITKSTDPFTNYSQLGSNTITREKNRYTFEFRMNSASTTEAQVLFNLGNSDIDVYLDNVVLKQKVVTIVEKGNPEIPDNFYLSQNYPNPFNPKTEIEFSLPEQSSVKFSVFNSLGQLVKEIKETDYQLGYHTISFKGNDLPSGVYYYKIIARSKLSNELFTDTKKMLILK